MKADQTAKLSQNKDNKQTTPVGLQVTRKPLKEWCCRFAERCYDSLIKIGEGTFRYFIKLIYKQCIQSKEQR